MFLVAGGNPRPPALSDNPANANVTYDFHHGIRDVKNDAIICFVLNSPPQ